MEKRTKKQIGWGAGFGAALVTLAVLAPGPDEDESFTITGKVVEASDESLSLKDIIVVSGSGDVDDTFVDEEETLYDGYRDANCFTHETSQDLEALVASGKLATGTTVTVTGNLGSSKTNCIGEGFSSGSFLDTDHPTITDVQLGAG